MRRMPQSAVLRHYVPGGPHLGHMEECLEASRVEAGDVRVQKGNSGGDVVPMKDYVGECTAKKGALQADRAAELWVFLQAALVATLRMQVPCPGFAKAWYGYIDPCIPGAPFFNWLNWLPSSLFSTSYRSWASWWSPSFYDSAAVDYKCGIDPQCLRQLGGA